MKSHAACKCESCVVAKLLLLAFVPDLDSAEKLFRQGQKLTSRRMRKELRRNRAEIQMSLSVSRSPNRGHRNLSDIFGVCRIRSKEDKISGAQPE